MFTILQQLDSENPISAFMVGKKESNTKKDFYTFRISPLYIKPPQCLEKNKPVGGLKH